jgi:hypothetical protein
VSVSQDQAQLLPQRLPALASGVMLALTGAPFAWLALICVGHSLVSSSCVAPGLRTGVPGNHWIWPTIMVLLIAGTAIGIRATIYCARGLLGAGLAAGNGDDGADSGAARTHVLALWGTIFGAGNAMASAMSVVAYLVLPHCGR